MSLEEPIEEQLEEQLDKGTSPCKGICVCSDKCTCTNITFLIFQSGNVIATGFKSQEQITLAVQDFLSLCDKFKKNIQKKTLSIFPLFPCFKPSKD